MGAKSKLKRDGELPILEKYELMNKIKQLGTTRDRALVSFLYLTGCRISEVCPYIIEINKQRVKVDKQTKEKIKEPILERSKKGHAITRQQIEYDKENGILKILQVRSLKRRKHIPRTVPIIVSKEKEFVEILFEYLNTLKEDEALFPITRQRAYQILSEIGLFNHYLRHLRLTRLSVEYGFSAQELKAYVNWGSSNSADAYVHLNVQNLIDKMQR